MPDVAFRTHELSSKVGYPTRAKPCACNRQVIDPIDGYCITCGRESKRSIDREWAQQNWRNQKASRKSSRRPFREVRNGNVYRVVFDRERAA